MNKKVDVMDGQNRYRSLYFIVQDIGDRRVKDTVNYSEAGEGGSGSELPKVDAGWTRVEGEKSYYYVTPPNNKGKRRKVSVTSHISEVIKHRGYPESIRNFIVFSKKKPQVCSTSKDVRAGVCKETIEQGGGGDREVKEGDYIGGGGEEVKEGENIGEVG